MEEAKKVANENFDWNAFENDLGVYDQPKEQIGEAYDKTLSNIAANEVTEGTVIGINKRGYHPHFGVPLQPGSEGRRQDRGLRRVCRG